MQVQNTVNYNAQKIVQCLAQSLYVIFEIEKIRKGHLFKFNKRSYVK